MQHNQDQSPDFSDDVMSTLTKEGRIQSFRLCKSFCSDPTYFTFDSSHVCALNKITKSLMVKTQWPTFTALGLVQSLIINISRHFLLSKSSLEKHPLAVDGN